jgi:hypothetical protein
MPAAPVVTGESWRCAPEHDASIGREATREYSKERAVCVSGPAAAGHDFASRELAVAPGPV